VPVILGISLGNEEEVLEFRQLIDDFVDVLHLGEYFVKSDLLLCDSGSYLFHVYILEVPDHNDDLFL
jgi:hypothetical protein